MLVDNLNVKHVSALQACGKCKFDAFDRTGIGKKAAMVGGLPVVFAAKGQDYE